FSVRPDYCFEFFKRRTLRRQIDPAARSPERVAATLCPPANHAIDLRISACAARGRTARSDLLHGGLVIAGAAADDPERRHPYLAGLRAYRQGRPSGRLCRPTARAVRHADLS